MRVLFLNAAVSHSSDEQTDCTSNTHYIDSMRIRVLVIALEASYGRSALF